VRIATTLLLTLALAGSAQASTLTLDVAGPYERLAPRVYFVPRSGAVDLRGTVRDDSGAAGASCFAALRAPLAAPAFTEAGVWCPSAGGWSGGLRVTENERIKVAVVPDARNSAAESPVITLLTAPELSWSGSRRAVRFRVAGGSDAYAGRLDVRQDGRLVASARVSGARRDLRIRIARRAHSIRPRGGAFTATLAPADRERWTAVAATGRPLRGHAGEGRPVLQGQAGMPGGPMISTP
jgi:hypothetical protein